MAERTEVLTGELVDAEARFTLRELCEVCGVHADLVLDLVDYGVVEPEGPRPERWRFSLFAVRRVQRALRLRHDFGLGLPGLSLSLDLLDELEDLRHTVQRLERDLRLLGH